MKNAAPSCDGAALGGGVFESLTPTV